MKCSICGTEVKIDGIKMCTICVKFIRDRKQEEVDRQQAEVDVLSSTIKLGETLFEIEELKINREKE